MFRSAGQQPLTLDAAAEGITHPVYQFWIMNPAGQWTQSGAYGLGQYQFTPQKTGTYTVMAYAKDPYAPATSQYSVVSTQTVLVQ